ncbi:MAG: aspartate/glutamate racemase family protein [Negativicutes bacterium]|nr:aspartate/glutamate racemase family protein [Negativicutes bacterium]
MKTIGLIGGMSWESSIEYYRLINEYVKERLGGLHSCQCLMYSVDFAEIEVLQHQGRWEELGVVLAEAARRVEQGGADFVLICTNTMHKVADAVVARVGIPLLHIADATAEEIKRQGLDRVGLLGTRFTMEQDFYKNKLDEHGIRVIVPNQGDIEVIHAVIYDELVVGKISDISREKVTTIMSKLASQGAQGIVLGCTELPLLVRQTDSRLPLFNTMLLHASQAVDRALGTGPV